MNIQKQDLCSCKDMFYCYRVQKIESEKEAIKTYNTMI